MLVGPAAGGIIVKLSSSNVTPFFFALALDLTVLVYVLLVVRDPPKRPTTLPSPSPSAPPPELSVVAREGTSGVGVGVGVWTPVKHLVDTLGGDNWARTVLVGAMLLYTIGTAGGRAGM
ncbi:hypothetical protein HDU93_000409 [Gonapodya sp. JEL0774]|nr:hypothetical protein HDU93_000409 [Gonapodya sp. JEL0774]